MKKIVATQKFIRTSPRKLRVVADLVRDLTPARASEVLPYIGKRAALPLQKVIKTAIANAQVAGISAENLEFSELQINEGPRLKRMRAGSRGRGKPYKRGMSHIRVVLNQVEAKKAEPEEIGEAKFVKKVKKAKEQDGPKS